MTLEPRHSPVVPSYGSATLADLSSSVLASLDPGSPDTQNVLGLAPAQRACLLIVDGLGWELLRDHPAAAPFLSELARNSKPITAGFPSTTVTSLGSICTGRPPGQHGMLGYQVIIPGENRLLNGLRWDSKVDPLQWQPLPTLYERATEAGIAAVHVAQGSFRGTGLTVATMRGSDFRPADSMGALAAQAAAALATRTRARTSPYTTVTWTALATCSVSPRTPGTTTWRTSTSWPSRSLVRCPPAACLYVTADHGMVDIGPEDKLDIDALPEPAGRAGPARRRAASQAPVRAAGRRRGRAGQLAGGARRSRLGAVAGRGRQGRMVRPGGRPHGRPDRRRRGRAGRVAGPGGQARPSRESPRCSACTDRSPPHEQLVPALTFRAA